MSNATSTQLIKTALDAGYNLRCAQENPIQVDGSGTYLVIPSGYELSQVHEPEESPRRVRGTVTTYDCDSFIAYVDKFASDGTTIYASNDGITAILNGHRPTSPDWCDHIAKYCFRETEEWQAWVRAQREPMSQLDIAELIEDNIHTIAAPDGATLLACCNNFKAKKSVNFTSVRNMDNGDIQAVFEESTNDGSLKGEMKLPNELTLVMEPFCGSGSVPVIAKFRYRLSSTTLRFHIKLMQATRVLESAIDNVSAKVEKELKRKVLNGNFKPIDKPQYGV